MLINQQFENLPACSVNKIPCFQSIFNVPQIKVCGVLFVLKSLERKRAFWLTSWHKTSALLLCSRESNLSVVCQNLFCAVSFGETILYCKLHVKRFGDTYSYIYVNNVVMFLKIPTVFLPIGIDSYTYKQPR